MNKQKDEKNIEQTKKLLYLSKRDYFSPPDHRILRDKISFKNPKVRFF